ncbi:heme peroxidase [Periconia macrospinosa]|uniref:Heme peroxidase n=1 Tax=Periconia macrospinosa TaxID=97972 RepID=A0A2V1E2Z6_9PLEO|nr:heme peroxidase [Periconia macrospinosa]
MSTTAWTIALLFTSLHYTSSAAPTWPSSVDELEDILFLNSGYHARGFANPVTPCSKTFGPGRVTAAAWVRTAFHDAISGNIYLKTGGLDGSIQFEINSGENNGQSIPTAVGMWAPFLSNRTSLSDVIAAGVYAATRSCGGPAVPVRGGHKDAIKAGPIGSIPQPQNTIGTFTNQFASIGMDRTAMIQIVACGHTLGSVHFPDTDQVIDQGTFTDDSAPFDSTPSTFDTTIATEYLQGTTKDPLVVGRSVASKRNSDFVIFNSDGNTTITALQNAQTFSTACRSLFQQMIEVVPSGVVLTDVITPYDVKPYDVQLTLLDGGANISLTGDIRIRTSQIKNAAAVQLLYKDRTGTAVSTPIETFVNGLASGFDDSYTFLGFSTDLPADKSISSFDVRVLAADGSSTTYNNNGNSFQVDDKVIYQAPQSCSGSGKLTAVAAVRNDMPVPQLQVVAKVPRASPNPVPSLSTTSIPMATQSAVGAYQLYSADYTIPSSLGSVTFGVYAGGSADTYKNGSSLASACKPLSTTPPNPPPSPPTSVFWGCYSDSFDARALSYQASDSSSVTLESCASQCSQLAYKFSGVEYGSQCWCGNSLDSSSTIQPLSECTQPCSGDPSKLCGGALRLSLYGPSPPRVSNSGPTSSATSSSTRSSSATSTPSSTPTPTAIPSLEGYDYVGCLSDSVNNRTLYDRSQSTPTNNYTTCASFCSGYEFFGVEYSSECYCGISLLYNITEPLSSCSYPCSGDPSAFCGGSSRLTVFRSQSATGAPRNPPIPGYTYKGCYIDSVGARTLGDKVYFDAQLTVEKCAAQCQDFTFFGTEYGGECYCGNELKGDLGKGVEAECQFLCGGDKAEFCGAGNRLSVYEKSA